MRCYQASATGGKPSHGCASARPDRQSFRHTAAADQTTPLLPAAPRPEERKHGTLVIAAILHVLLFNLGLSTAYVSRKPTKPSKLLDTLTPNKPWRL